MADAATSTIRACRKSCATSPRARSTTATGCPWRPAIGMNWRSTEPITRPSASISTAPARAEKPATIPSAGWCLAWWGDRARAPRWGASNTSFVERDAARRLRGYDDRPALVEVRNPSTGKMDRVLRYDYRELVPLLRHRREPNHPEVRRVLDRPRDVRMSIDARLEVKVAEILRNQLKQSGLTKGAAVVMDPATGDLLAAVSFPLPVE